MVERAVRFQRRHMASTGRTEQIADMLQHFHAGDSSDREEVIVTVRTRVAQFVDTEDYDDASVTELWELYVAHVSQLRAICADHSLSHTRSAMLTEEEVMVSLERRVAMKDGY